MNKIVYNRIFWSLITLLSTYYLYRAFRFRFVVEGLGPSFWNKQFWYVLHISVALLPLILGPFQFWNWFRQHHMKWHRLLGKVYLVGSVLGGLSAFYLGATLPLQGSVVPIILLSWLWLFMTVAAWITIRRKNIKAHRLFMIRSYVLALVFIWLRILDDLIYKHGFLSFIGDEGIKSTTHEWMSWVIPLLVMEMIISWWPLIKAKPKLGKVVSVEKIPTSNKDIVDREPK